MYGVNSNVAFVGNEVKSLNQIRENYPTVGIIEPKNFMS